jgi:hypothetical protein
MKRFWLASAAAVALISGAGSALAADLSRPPPPVMAAIGQNFASMNLLIENWMQGTNPAAFSSVNDRLKLRENQRFEIAATFCCAGTRREAGK